MSRQQHSIAKHVFKISYPHKDKAPALQQKLIQLFKEKLYPALAIYMDKHFDTNEIMKIDSLVLNAGHITITDLDNELSEKVMILFKDALKGYFTKPYKANIETGLPNGSPSTIKENDLELVAYYLLNGILPSRAIDTVTNNPIKIIEQLLVTNPQLLIQLLRKVWKGSNVRLRITRQLPAAVIRNIIRQLSPVDADFIISYQKELSRAQLEKQLVKAEHSIFKQKVWEFILDFLLIKQSSVFSQQVFVKNNLTSIAAYFNISFEEILRFFYALVKDHGTTTVATASLQHIILSISEDLSNLKNEVSEDKKVIELPVINKLQPVQNLNEKQLEALSYFLLRGLLPWWAKNNSVYDPAQLFLKLSTAAVEQLRNLFSTITSIDEAAKNLSFLPADTLHAIITLLAPSKIILIEKYVQEFNKLVDKTIIIGADKNYTQQKILEKTFHYLLNIGKGNFNENDFAKNVLHQFSIDLKINFQLLILKDKNHKTPLLKTILSNFTTNLPDQKKSAKLKNEQAIYLAAIGYYLRSGTFPVWAFVTSRTHARVILNELLKTHSAQTISLLQVVSQNSGALLRLIKIGDADTVHAIAAQLVPAQHAFINTYLQALFTMPGNVQSSLGIYKEGVFKMVTEYLFNKKNHFNKEDFLLFSFQTFKQHSTTSTQVFQVLLVQHLFQKNNPDEQWKDLLDTLAAVKPMLTTKYIPLLTGNNEPAVFLRKAIPDKFLINKNKENNTIIIKEDKKKLYDSILDILKYFILYKTLPFWLDEMQQKTPDELLEELLLNDTDNAKELFKFAGASQAMTDFWLLTFSLQKTEKLLREFPQSSINFSLIQLIAAVFQGPFYSRYLTMEKTVSLLIKTLWQAYNKTAYTSLDTTVFILQFIKQYEFALHIPEGYLQPNLIHEIVAVLVKNNFSFIAGKLQFHHRETASFKQADKQSLLKTALIEYQLLNQENRFTYTITEAVNIFEYFIQWQKFPGQFNNQLLTEEEILATLIYLLAQEAPVLFKQLLQQLVVGSSSWHLVFKQVAKNSSLPNEYVQVFIEGATTDKLLEHKKSIVQAAVPTSGLDKSIFLWELQDIATGSQNNFDGITNTNKEDNYPFKIAVTSSANTGNAFTVANGLQLPVTLAALKDILAQKGKLKIQAQNEIYLEEQSPSTNPSITFRDIKDFKPKPAGLINDDEYLANGAEALLKNFLLYDRLPSGLSNSTTAVKESWLKQLLVLISKKKPSLLSYLLQQQNHIAQNAILLHRIFSYGQDITGRNILAALNQFIEKDIARAINATSSIVSNHTNIRELLDQLKYSTPPNEWIVKLTKLITADKQLIYYLPNYLQPTEIQAIVQQKLSNEQANYLRQLGVMLQQTKLQSAHQNGLLALYHAFMLQYIVESKRGSFSDILGYFLSFVEKENDTLLFRLLPVLLDVVVLKSDEILFIKPISRQVEIIIIAHAKSAAGNKLLELPFARQGFPQLLPPLTNPSKEVQANTAESNVVYPTKAIENKELMKESICIKNAGLILFTPLLSTYFNRLSMLKDGHFISETETARAVHLLEYIVDGLGKHEEHLLVLNKLLCNLPLSYAITDGIELTSIEMEVTAQLYAAMQQQWPQIKNSSFDGFRVSFLQRDGILTLGEEGWNLVVEQRAYDVLLQTLPWSFGMIKTPWMDKILTAIWT